MTVSVMDIVISLIQVKCGETAGCDDLYVEYFKFTHDKLHVLLSMCFTFFTLISAFIYD